MTAPNTHPESPSEVKEEEWLESLWLEVAEEVGDQVAPKQPHGSLERKHFLLTQALIYKALIPKIKTRLTTREKAAAEEARVDELIKLKKECQVNFMEPVDNTGEYVLNRLKQLAQLEKKGE